MAVKLASSPNTSVRLALVSGSIPLGGSTTFLINFAGELVRRGIPVLVISLERENPLGADFQKQNIPVLCLDNRGLIFEDRLAVALRELSVFQPTAVVATLGASSFEILRYLPAGVVRIGMGQSDDPLVYAMMRHYAPWMDLVAMVSRAMQEKAAAMPEFARVPVAYLPYGVPMCADAALPARNWQQPLRLLYLGRLGREQKRVHLFPEIFAQLCASGIPFHWTIAGVGEERAFLEANLISPSPRQTVHFAGSVNYAAVPGLLQTHAVYLLASDYEGLPLSLLEAMGYGVVPVVSDLRSGISEVVDATTGLLVPVADTAGYARAIVHLHAHREELAAKSAAARARVRERFSVAAMTEQWLRALPAPPASVPQWPRRWKIGGPLTSTDRIYFSPPARFFRRLVTRFRKQA